jgi:hypothetical protein
MSKKCFKCGEEKPRSEFYRHPQMGDGLLGKCKECAKRDVRQNRKKRISYYREYDVLRFRDDPERRHRASLVARRRRAEVPSMGKAHSAVSYAIRTKKLTRQPCEVCGRTDSHAHHDDYSKPLDVRWLCPPHHREVHGGKKY